MHSDICAPRGEAPSSTDPVRQLAERLTALLGRQAGDDRNAQALMDLALNRCAATCDTPAQREAPSGRARRAGPTETEAPPGLAELLDREARLFSLPEVYARLDALMKNPLTTPGDVTELIATDPALSATLLKLVNSAFIGRGGRAMGHRLAGKVDSLERAVMILGTSQLANLALALSVAPAFKDIDPEIMDMRQFWEHSLSCGLLARELAALAGIDPELAFVAGLLHDIGRLTMLKGHSAHVAQAIGMAIERDVPLCHIEKELWGFDHAELGGRLLRSWRFPASLEHAVAAHHAYHPNTDNQDAALVHVADILAHVLRMGASGAHAAPPLSPAAWPQLNLPLSALGAAAAQAERQLDDIGHILLSDHG